MCYFEKHVAESRSRISTCISFSLFVRVRLATCLKTKFDVIPSRWSSFWKAGLPEIWWNRRHKQSIQVSYILDNLSGAKLPKLFTNTSTYLLSLDYHLLWHDFLALMLRSFSSPRLAQFLVHTWRLPQPQYQHMEVVSQNRTSPSVLMCPKQ